MFSCVDLLSCIESCILFFVCLVLYVSVLVRKVSIELSVVTCPTYPEKFIRHSVIALSLLLSVVIATLPYSNCLWNDLHCFGWGTVKLFSFAPQMPLFCVDRSCCSLGLHCERLVRLNLSSCPLLSDQGLIALRYVCLLLQSAVPVHMPVDRWPFCGYSLKGATSCPDRGSYEYDHPSYLIPSPFASFYPSPLLLFLYHVYDHPPPFPFLQLRSLGRSPQRDWGPEPQPKLNSLNFKRKNNAPESSDGAIIDILEQPASS